MPIIFNDAPTEARDPSKASANAKRKLRRIRISAAKTGLIVPYEPVSRPAPEPVDAEAPKMTNTAKRMARKRKKYAAHMAELGLTVEEGGTTYFKPEKKKKKKNSGSVVVGVEKKNCSESDVAVGVEKSKSSVATEKTTNTSKHIVFGSDNEEQPGPSNTEKKKKKKKQTSEDKPLANTCLPEKSDVSQAKNGDESDNELAREETKPPNDAAEAQPNAKKGKKVKKQRFILFVGNLSYEITEAEIAAHFVKVGKIVSIRIARHMEESMQGKCKGFAHLEVPDEEAYLKAMSMHHSLLRNRRINVEFSKGQTKDMRRDQKERTRATKNAIASGNYLDLANPCDCVTKKKKRSQQTQQRQASANKIWL